MHSLPIIYIFNPDHDMALANFTWYYKTPAEISIMADDLSFLPAWYCDPMGSRVKINDINKLEVFIHQTSKFKVFEEHDFTSSFYKSLIVPWGWNPSLYHLIKEYLPEQHKLVDMDKIRYLSSRQRCVGVLNSFNDLNFACGEAFVAKSLDEVKLLEGRLGNIILKSPWSGSGRGLLKLMSSNNLQSSIDTKNEGWISRIIRNQGCIMVEPLYNKITDFAMEFFSDGSGNVVFCGYSLFETDTHGNYKQNILMSDERVESHLSCYIKKEYIYIVKEKLRTILSDMVKNDYRGYLGVDMMIVKDDLGCFKIHPCVEINMRMNMGVVSRIFFDRYVCKSSTGKYIIEHYFSDGDALLNHSTLESEYPLKLNPDGRIKSGYLTLTPVMEKTRYHVFVIIE